MYFFRNGHIRELYYLALIEVAFMVPRDMTNKKGR